MECCGLLHHYNFTWVISKTFRKKYIYKMNCGSYALIPRTAIKQLLSGVLSTWRLPTNFIKTTSSWLLFDSYLEPHSLMSSFANRNILLTSSCFIRQCKTNIQNSHFCKNFHVRCHINWVQDLHLMFYLNSHFLLVK